MQMNYLASGVGILDVAGRSNKKPSLQIVSAKSRGTGCFKRMITDLAIQRHILSPPRGMVSFSRQN